MPVTKEDIADAALAYFKKYRIYGMPGAWDEHRKMSELVKQYEEEQEESDPPRGTKKR